MFIVVSIINNQVLKIELPKQLGSGKEEGGRKAIGQQCGIGHHPDRLYIRGRSESKRI